VRTADEDRLVGHLGPDPLSADWDPVEAARRLSGDTRAIHVAIQDQRNIAGFGNEYANEILFVRGILPTTPADETDAAAIVDLGSRMIRANRNRVDRTFTGDVRAGRTTWVYGREGRPCRRCGALIRRSSLGADPTRERIVFWCPSCQAAARSGSPPGAGA
jgi:endonuclease-8